MARLEGRVALITDRGGGTGRATAERFAGEGAKGGISALTRSMTVQYAADRIRVNAIEPSVTLSERVKKQLDGNPATEELGRQRLLGPIEPIYIADMAVYLASEESARTTGQILPVDSGVMIR